MPLELSHARLIDGLCQRYGCPPSVILAEDAAQLLPMLAILEAAGDFEQPEAAHG